jgi:outer membrane protein
LALLALTAGLASAADRVGYVDVQAAVERSERAAAAQKDLQSQVQRERSQLGAKRQRVQRLREELKKQGSLMSAEQRDKKEMALQKAVQAFQQARRSAQQALDQRRQRVLQDLYKEVEAIAANLAEQEGLDRVLRASAVLYPGDGVNLTDRVVERLNARAPGNDGGASQ